MIYSVLFNFGHIRHWDQCAVFIFYRPTYRPIVDRYLADSVGRHIGRHVDRDLAVMSNTLRIFQYLYYCYSTSDRSTLSPVTSDVLCNIYESKK